LVLLAGLVGVVLVGEVLMFGEVEGGHEVRRVAGVEVEAGIKYHYY